MGEEVLPILSSYLWPPSEEQGQGLEGHFGDWR